MSNEDSFHLGIKALIRNAAGRVLLLQVNAAKLHSERNSYWDLPGGRVQKGHTILDTLQREVTEETAVTTIKSVKQVGMFLSNIRIPLGNDGSVGLILGIYECAVGSSEKIVLSDEHIAYDWFTPREAAKLLAIKYPSEFCSLVASL